jgi:hypothetical protein
MMLAWERPERWRMNFCVREWVDIDVGLEFRGFVSGGAPQRALAVQPPDMLRPGSRFQRRGSQ